MFSVIRFTWCLLLVAKYKAELKITSKMIWIVANIKQEADGSDNLVKADDIAIGVYWISPRTAPHFFGKSVTRDRKRQKTAPLFSKTPRPVSLPKRPRSILPKAPILTSKCEASHILAWSCRPLWWILRACFESVIYTTQMIPLR